MKYNNTLAFLCAAFAARTANAFGVFAPRAGNTALHLLPTQGNQLVAASSSAYDGEHDEDHHHPVKTTSKVEAVKQQRSAIAAARSFAAAVFSLPSSLLHPHPAKEIPDEVLYPITGFQYVLDQPGHCRVLPTVSNPSCSLPQKEQPIYGWYSPACRLDSTLDDETYAAHPKDELN